jgi:hypothetical protein
MDGTRSALIVASYEYADPALGRLRAPASDAQALARVLEDPNIGRFDVRTLLNRPAHEVTLAVEEFFADRGPDDLLLLHFSCHGVKDESGDLYLAMTNTLLRRLGATAVPADFVNRRMTRSRSRRVVLLLDCCYAGAFERGMTARAGAGVGIETQFGGRGRAVITASSAMEYAFEGDELADSSVVAPSVFTSALVEGLETGDADRDQDGLVALDELYDFIYDKVRSTTPNQTPGKWTFGIQGELVIAQRSRPVRTPSPLPAELLEAIDSSLAAVRLAAVQELERLLGGRHAGLALGASLALQQLTADDSRTVAAAAAQALATGGKRAPTEADPPAAAEPARAVGIADPHQGREAPVAPRTSALRDRLNEPSLPGAGAAEPDSKERAGESTVTSAVRADAEDGVSPPAGQRLSQAGGVAAILGAVLAVAAMFPTFAGGWSLTTFLPAKVWETALQAAAALAAGVCLFVPGTRRLIGPGLLLGALLTSPIGVLYNLLYANVLTTRYHDALNLGFWLDSSAYVAFTIAIWLVGVSVARSGDVRVTPRLPDGVRPRLVILVGAVGSLALVLQVVSERSIPGEKLQFSANLDLAPLLLTALAALLIPATAAVAAPRRFGVSLLAGWIAGGVAIVAFYTSVASSLFGLSLVALLAAAIAFAIGGRPRQTEPKGLE